MTPRDQFRRAYLFARDYCGQFGIAWSLARMRDCERNGGHRWKAPEKDGVLIGWWRDCSRCGCSESLAETQSTTGTSTIWVTPNQSTAS